MMNRLKDFLMLSLFPLIYISIDLWFRYKYLANYTSGQFFFYWLSILFTFLIFMGLLASLSKYDLKPSKKALTAFIAASYYVFSVFSSYLFLNFTGIFPNYYTFIYFKNEPKSAFFLLYDSIHTWEVILFLLFMTLLLFYFYRAAATQTAQKILRKIKRRFLIIPILLLLVSFTVNIHKIDQCIIVDANFTAAINRHIWEGNDLNTYKQSGLPERQPILLPSRMTPKPKFNLLLIIFESLRKQNMQLYGYQRATTPFLNTLQSTRPESFFVFKNAFTASTTTMLAIPAILSGAAPWQSYQTYVSLPLAWEYATSAQYHTFFISAHSSDWYRFDKYYAANKPDLFWNKETSGLDYYNDFGIDERKMIDFFTAHLESLNQKKFLGVVQFNTTHYPYTTPADFERWNGQFIDQYDNAILYQDHLLKKVFETLKKQKLLDNTLIIMVGDHGEAFKEHNNIGHFDSFYTETLSIPLLFYIPKALQQNLSLSQFKANLGVNVSNLDITPTLLYLLNIARLKPISKIKGQLEGVNLFAPIDSHREIITLNSNELLKSNVGVSILKGSEHLILKTNRVPCSKEFYQISQDYQETQNLFQLPPNSSLLSLKDTLSKNPHTLEVLKACGTWE